MDDPTSGDLASSGPGAQAPADSAAGVEQPAASADPSRATPRQPAPPLANEPFAPPTYPGMPGVPLAWAQPANPSVPLGAPAPGSSPTYPGYPAQYAGYPSTPLAPYGVPPQSDGSSLKGILATPFPAWLSAFIGVAAAVLVLIAFFASVLVGGADWADGAGAAGLIAFGLAAIALIVAIVRGSLGRKAVSMLVLSAVLVVGLTVVGATSIFASPQIHGFQAHTLESSHDWQAAVNEYMLSGEQAPNAPDVARVLDEQGEQQFASGQYAAAVATFTTVRTTYGQSGAAVTRATTGTFNAYSAWVKSSAGDVPYSDAIAFFDLYRSAASCESACATTTAEVEAQALYQYGSTLAEIQNYKDAVTQFEKLTADFPTSTYASQAHAAAATAYLAEGQQAITTSCAALDPFDATSSASASYQSLLLIYQTLSTKYSDTPEGVQAAAALKAPQSVSGMIVNAPSGSSVALMLSKHADPQNSNFSANYGAKPDSHGNFTFHNVALGAYNLAGTVTTSTNITTIWYYDKATNNLYDFHVYALCPITGVAFDASVS